MHIAESAMGGAVDLAVEAPESASLVGIKVDPDAQALGASGNHRVHVATLAPLPAMIGDDVSFRTVVFGIHWLIIA